MNKLVTREFGDKMAATMRVMKIFYCTNKKAHLGETSIISLENIKKKSTEGREVRMDLRSRSGLHLRLILGFRAYIGL